MKDRTTADATRAERGRKRNGVRVLTALAVVLLSCTLVGITGGAGVASAATPNCTFTNGIPGKPMVSDVKPGQTIAISCTGLPALTPYLLITTSLLVAIDPAAQPLLEGQLTSAAGVEAVVSALPEMNAASSAFPISDLNGNLSYSYTLPTSQALDPNAVCPPTTEQLNSGLIGCAVAMIDLESGKPEDAGTFLVSYAGDPIFPPAPTLALPSRTVAQGQAVSVGDAPGAKTYWWLGTLSALDALLSGSAGGPATVTVNVGKKKVVSHATVTPATYSNSVFTPPKLSGTFVVPKVRGKRIVTVSLNADLLGFILSNTATTTIKAVK